MPIENERKYLLNGIHPTILRNRLVNRNVEYDTLKITQSYIARDMTRGFVERVRSIQHKDESFQYILTQKIGFGETVHELEHEINKEQYDEYIEFFTMGDTIHKTRYIIPMHNGTKWEIDSFAGKHAGILVAEMELPTPDTEIIFHPVLGNPEFLTDVSNDKKYKNWYMAGI